MFRGGLRAQKSSFEVDPKHPVPFFLRHVDYRNTGHHSGTVKKNIHLAVLGQRLLHHFADALFAADIDLDSGGLSSRLTDLLGSFLRDLFGVICDDDLVAVGRHATADVRPDTASPTRDDNYLIHDCFPIFPSPFFRDAIISNRSWSTMA